jgi:CTP:molybdopterin cytidylyltransferase MocA
LLRGRDNWAVARAGIVLAAGEASRFGGAKQLAPLDGRPMLEHVLETMAAVCDELTLVLGARAAEIAAAVQLHGATPVVCDDWREGTWASVRCGLRHVGPEAEEIVIALGDQPTLTADRVERVLAAPGPIVRALDRGAPSHPLVIRRGAVVTREALRNAGGVELPPLADVDTREQLVEITGQMPSENR